MKQRGAWLILASALALLGGGAAWLVQLRVAQDLFPPYSTLRADPLGVRVLYDSLARLPGFEVERRLEPLASLEPVPARTIVLAGMEARSWSRFAPNDFRALDDAVRAGSRLVIAQRTQFVMTPDEVKDAERREVREDAAADPLRVEPLDLGEQWGFTVRVLPVSDASEPASRVMETAADALPSLLTWKSEAYLEFNDATAWTILYRRAGRPVLAERTHGRGTLVLASDAYFLSNEALQQERSVDLLAWIIGPHNQIVFDESHLGVQAKGGIAALARRYGMAGAFFTLLLLAALFIWRRMSLFVPPAEASSEVALAYHPAAGLEALLRRSVPEKELVTTCLSEWRPSVPANRSAQAEAALAAHVASDSAVSRYNRILRALRRR